MATETSESENFFRRSSFVIDGVDSISISVGPSIADFDKDVIMECPECKKFPKFKISSPSLLSYECECSQKGQSKEIKITDLFEKFIQKTNEKCNNHPSIPSNSFCQICNKFFCSECLNEHNREEKNGEHEITHTFIDKKTFCSSHKNELAEYYCLNCRLHICSNCLNYHLKHTFWKLKEIIKENTFQNLYSIYLLAKKKIEENNKYLQERIIDQINTQINEQILIFTEKKNDYIKQITKSYQKSKEINQNLLKFYNLLLNHYSSTFSNPSYNSIYNLQNIKVNLDCCEYQSAKDLETNYQNILKYFKENFVLQNGKVNFNNLHTLLENDYPSEMHCLSTVLINKEEPLAETVITSKNESLNSLIPTTVDPNIDNLKFLKVTAMVSLTNKMLIACLNSGDILFYDYNDRLLVNKQFKAHDGPISSISILKNKDTNSNTKISSYLITSSNDMTIKIFDIDTFTCIDTIKEFTDKIVKVVQLKDSNIFANSQNGRICLFHGIHPYSCIFKYENATLCSNFIELSDGRIAICGTNTFQIISLNKLLSSDFKSYINNNHHLIKNFPCQTPNSMVEISKRKVLVGSKGKIFIVNFDNCTIENRIEDSNLGLVLSMVILIDGSLLVGDNGGNLFRFNQTFHYMTMMEDCHSSGVSAMCMNHLGNVITGSYEIRHWTY